MLGEADLVPAGGGEGEVGEIAIKGENVMKGYWGREEATAESIVDGWFHSGDMATVDDDGYFTIVDRKKDLIIRGGYNVYPREVEEALYEHEAVREAAVIGIQDDKMGEEVGAAVALKDGAEANAKSSLSLMTLGAKQGDRLLIRAEGDDEAAAVEKLAALVTEG